MQETVPYVVSARKYRPSTFQSVVGQKALTTTLKNAISGGRLAQAYLFCGPRGVGKTSCARIFAKTINCMNPTPDGEACGECESCKAIEKGNSFNLVELDAASNNSVDDIRNITDQVNVPAQDGRYRVFIIDEVHMLTNQAFNAFLKTLEEPPKNVVFILATTERHKVIPTILSRCQIYDFRRITVNDIIDHLQNVASREGISAEREALGVIALKADGAMRDALSIFDQVAASTGGVMSYQATIDALNVLDAEYYFKLIDIFIRGEVAEALLTLKEITDKGFDPQFFINGLASHIRDLMVAADPRTVKLLETSEEIAKRYSQQAPLLPPQWYYKALQILNDCDFQYKTSGNKRLSVELALIKLSRLLSNPFDKPDALKPERRSDVNPSSGIDVKNGKEDSAAPSSVPKSEKNSSATPRPVSETIPPKRKPLAKPTSFRIADATETLATVTDNKPKLREQFTDDQLKEAWNKFIEANPEQRILSGAMRSHFPERFSEDIFTIKVTHPAQQQAYESILPSLVSYLRQNLRNDFISLRIEEEHKEEPKDFVNPREFLKNALSENDELARFLKSIDAELE